MLEGITDQGMADADLQQCVTAEGIHEKWEIAEVKIVTRIHAEPGINGGAGGIDKPPEDGIESLGIRVAAREGVCVALSV